MRSIPLFILVLGSMACAYSGAIRTDFPASRSVESPKIPRQLLLVPDDSPEAKQLKVVGANTTVAIDLYPGLVNAVEAQLGTVFDTVVVAGSSQPAQGDLVAKMNFRVQELSRDTWNGRFEFEAALELLINDATSGRRITKIREMDRAVYTPSSETTAASVITGASLFLLSPFTIPWQTNSVGRHATEVLEQSIERLVQNLGEDVQNDDHLQAFLRGEPAGASIEPGAAAPPVVVAVESDVDHPQFQIPSDPNSFAVVVGIEKYSNDLPPAQFADRDASAVRENLIALGFPPRNIKFLAGALATKSAMEAYLEDWLPKNVKQNSRVFVYFSGHGAPDPKSGQAYLVPVDGNPTYLDKTAFPVKRLYADMRALKAHRVVIALDSCFSGAGGRSVLAEGARPLVNRVDAAIGPGGGLLLFAAASPTQVTSTIREQGHGSFTYYLLKGLGGAAKNANGVVTPQGLYKYLKPNVEDAASRQNREQTPVMEGAAAGELVRFQ